MLVTEAKIAINRRDALGNTGILSGWIFRKLGIALCSEEWVAVFTVVKARDIDIAWRPLSQGCKRVAWKPCTQSVEEILCVSCASLQAPVIR
jgi:hypothetical protein